MLAHIRTRPTLSCNQAELGLWPQHFVCVSELVIFAYGMTKANSFRPQNKIVTYPSRTLHFILVASLSNLELITILNLRIALGIFNTIIVGNVLNVFA